MYSSAAAAGPLLALLLGGLALSQDRARRPRPLVEPVNLVYNSEIEGVGIPIQEAYIRSADGLYIPAVLLRPQSEDALAAVILVHGAPGGRGMSALKREVQTRGMVAERFLEEGYLVVVTDYRGRQLAGREGPREFSYASDVVSVVRYTKQLPYVDPERVGLYSGSLGSETSILALGEESVAAAVLNAPGAYTYMRVSRDEVQPNRPSDGELSDDSFDQQLAREHLSRINSPLLLVVGTADGFLGTVKKTQAILAEMGKDSSIDIYQGERHGFYFGPGKTDGKYDPAPAFSKALGKAVEFFKYKTR